MRSVSIAQLKATLSEQVGHVKRGEEILVTERGRVAGVDSRAPILFGDHCRAGRDH